MKHDPNADTRSNRTSAPQNPNDRPSPGGHLAARLTTARISIAKVLVVMSLVWMIASTASAQYAGHWVSPNETEGYTYAHPEKDIYLDITINASGTISGLWCPYVIYFTMDLLGFPYAYLRAATNSSGTVSGSLGSGTMTLQGLGTASFSYGSPASATLLFTFSGISNLRQSKVIQAATPVATGSLTVTLLPAEAASTGAQWRRTGTSAWQNSAATETGVPVGGYTVEFSGLDGWISPNSVNVTIRENQTDTASGTYTRAPAPTLTPSSRNHSSGAGSGSFSVATAAAASWSAVANQSWLHTSSRGTGSGTVTYTLDANPNNAFRTGTITVSAQSFTITQGPAGYNWHAALGWVFNAGGGWYNHNGLGWMWFHPGGQWMWSGNLQGWVATTDSTSRTLWSPQFRWLTPSASDPYKADTTSIGSIYIGKFNGAAITDGWVVSDRFGFVWANGDGKWFYSNTYGWLGVTDGGGVWCVNQNRFL